MKQRNRNGTEPKIRLARLEDIPAIRRYGKLVLRCACTESELDQQRQQYLDQVFTRLWNADYLQRTVADQRTAFLVAEVKEKIAGIALVIPKADEARTVALSRLIALPPYRQGSLPRRLLWGCEQFSPGHAERLETCVPQTDAAQARFYENLGFRRGEEITLGQGPLANAFYVFVKPLDRQRIACGLAAGRTHPASSRLN